MPSPCPVPAHRMPQRPDSFAVATPRIRGRPLPDRADRPEPLPPDPPAGRLDAGRPARSRPGPARGESAAHLPRPRRGPLPVPASRGGGETVSDDIPRGGIVVAGRLRLPEPIEAKRELLDRLDQLHAFLVTRSSPFWITWSTNGSPEKAAGRGDRDPRTGRTPRRAGRPTGHAEGLAGGTSRAWDWHE
jgi:hypothetical protein